MPKPGNSVRLTLDVKLQQAAEKALAYGINLAQANGEWAARGGAIVALDPSDGSILAMASSPTYKPSVYSGRVTTKALAAQGLTHKTAPAKNYPSLNRAMQATYPPGSVFKPVTALAAMQEHLVLPYAYLPCTGTYQSPNDRSHQVFHNWDPNVNQQMDLPTALAYSCDTYFYQLGDKFWSLPKNRGQPLQKWSRKFGFGSLTGSDVGPEVPGLVPTIGWKIHHFHTVIDRFWKPGDSIHLAIGQGDLLVTPLQMTRFYALLANGGKLVTPHLLLDVQDPNGAPVPLPARRRPRPCPASTPLRSRSSGKDCSRERTCRSAPRIRSSGSSRSRSPARRERPRSPHAARLRRRQEPVVVVRLRPDGQRQDRRLRRDRERRPRRHRCGARRRPGARVLLPRQGETSDLEHSDDGHHG